MSHGKQKTNDTKKIKVDFFAEERNAGNKNMNIETNNIKRITYPKITFVIARYAIEKAVRNMSFHEMICCRWVFMNKKHTRLIKTQVRFSVKINGSIS